MSHPLAQCLVEYGADLSNIPRDGAITFDEYGIYVLEFEKDRDDPLAMEPGAVTMAQVFYPHPG